MEAPILGMIFLVDGTHCTMAALRKYPDELRERAVRLVQESGPPIAYVADDLGIHREALRGWVHQAEADRGQRSDLLSSAEREELKWLRAEVGKLRRCGCRECRPCWSGWVWPVSSKRRAIRRSSVWW